MGEKKAPFTLRTMIGLGLIIVLIFAMQPRVASSLVKATTTIANSGSINYNASGLPLSVFGDDYLIFQENTGNQPNGVPSLTWTTARLAKLSQYSCNTVRLYFSFPDDGCGRCSYYNYAKMSQVLDLLASVGAKGVLTWDRSFNGFFGSTAFVNDWVQVAKDFKGDSRVSAFGIAQEPQNADCASSGPVGAINSDAKVHKFMAYLIDQIRAIDPSRTIVYPPFIMLTDFYGYGHPTNWNQFRNDLQTYGILAKGNIVYDILHPYYWEYPAWDPVADPTRCADYYRDNEIIPAVSVFGASNVWIGETFPFSPNPRETTHGGAQFTTAQIAFETELINNFVAQQVGFSMMCYFSRQSDYNYDWYDVVLQASNYK